MRGTHLRRTILATVLLSATIVATSMGVGSAWADDDSTSATPISAATTDTPDEEPATDQEPAAEPEPATEQETEPAEEEASATPAPATTTPPAPTSASPAPTTVPTTPADKPVDTGRITLTSSVIAAEGSDTITGGVTVTFNSCNGNGASGSLTTSPDGFATQEVPYDCYGARITAWPASIAPTEITSFGFAVDDANPDRTIHARMQPVVDHNTDASGVLLEGDRITGAPLAGAVYRISTCDNSGADAFDTSATDENGSVPLSLMQMGCHRAVEVAAPAGYVLDPTPIYFDVADRQDFVVTALDTPIGLQPVARDVANRTPLKSIPSGPAQRR